MAGTKLVLLLFIWMMPALAQATLLKTGLKEAMNNGNITVDAIASGKLFYGSGLKFQIRNNTDQAIQLSFDIALIFQPTDTSFQDLITAGNEPMLVLAPKGKRSIEVQTFCGKSYARAPGGDLNFRFVRQGDSTMIRVLQFINKYKLYNNAGQHAVWVLTNHASLDGVFDAQQQDVSDKLIALIVQETGLKAPEDYKLYKINTVAGEPVFQKRVLSIEAKFEWVMPEEKTLSLGIYDQSGKLIQPVEQNRSYTKGRYKSMVSFVAENVRPGNYYIRLTDGNTVMKEKMVTVD